ncbi:hypothetical protein [Jiella mangrovi]|uniref:Lipocalin-like domain-containing protein n=1 Tax=Jiella mangrovi TaxID=2821407 RepID=A0ABS4BH06_9HYPH|nr:hypothetical protein [Jiella mangrovi]MBP0616032.1 hypothetical protein [Jiella mangrovi]
MPNAAIAFMLCLIVQTSGIAHAQTADFVGHWRQVSSNAGDCPRCSLDVVASRREITVKASNGWSAELAVQFEQRVAAAAGKGTWREGAGGSYGGLAFSVLFQLVDGRLHMQMMVPRPDGRTSRIEAVYERSALLSLLAK